MAAGLHLARVNGDPGYPEKSVDHMLDLAAFNQIGTAHRVLIVEDGVTRAIRVVGGLVDAVRQQQRLAGIASRNSIDQEPRLSGGGTASDAWFGERLFGPALQCAKRPGRETPDPE